MLTATIFTIFGAATKEPIKEVAWPNAAPPLLWWRPKATNLAEAMNIVNIAAVNTVLVLHLSQSGGLLAGRAIDWIYGGSDGLASDWFFECPNQPL